MKSKTIKVKVGNITVKVYARERAGVSGSLKFYQVADYTSGKRRWRGFKDESEARAEAKKIADQLASGDTLAAQMRNGEAAAYGSAIEALRPTGVRLELAASVYAKAFEILGGDNAIEAAKFYALHRADKIERRKVKEAVAELIAAREARGKSDRYVADLRARLNRFADSFAVDISTITGPDVQGWLDKLKVAPRTAKNFRSSLHTLFSFAESRGYILKGGNPVANTDEISADNNDPIEIYTPTEIVALLAAAPDSFKPFLAIGAFAGLRSAEIERLDWTEVDLTSGFIEIKAAKAKTRSRRLVPILPNLSQWLTSFASRTGKVWTGTANALIDARAETAEKAGVDWKNNALRHSFISYRLAEIQNAAQVSLEAGNSPAMVFKNYREVVKPDAAKAWFAISPEGPANVVSIPATALAQ